MSKTVDELARIYHDAYEDRARLEFPTPEMKRAMHRAGIAAVIRAVRDEMCACQADDERSPITLDTHQLWQEFQAILGDAGNEKVADTVAQKVEPLEVREVTGASPVRTATDPAPAVCEWKRVDEDVLESGCDPDGWTYNPEIKRDTCPSCGKPIKFTEAKT